MRISTSHISISTTSSHFSKYSHDIRPASRNMSVDFGPIPLPQSPLQDYFERKYRATSENVSPAPSAVTSPLTESNSIQEQLTKALTELAKQQAADVAVRSKDHVVDSEVRPSSQLQDGSMQRRGSSATSTGYTALSAFGLLKRRSMAASEQTTAASSRRTSR